MEKKNMYICINNMCSKYLENHYYFLSYLLYINCKALAKRSQSASFFYYFAYNVYKIFSIHFLIIRKNVNTLP